MLRWIFLITWVGILIALVAGIWVVVRLSLKLDRDHADRQMLMAVLERGLLAPSARAAEQPSED
jgi:hypothetical protein